MWFARSRRRRAHRHISALHAQLRAAERERKASVFTDPEHEARIAGIRAQVDEWRTDLGRGGYRR